MTMPILLFAAGRGTRMAPLTNDRPKPLIKVAGKALLDHALEFTEMPEIGPRVANIHAFPEMIRDHLVGTDIMLSDETDALLETGGGLRKAMPHLGASPTLTINTDAVWHGPNPIAEILAQWRDEMECLLLLVPRNHVHGHLGQGDFQIDANGRLHRGYGDIYTGVQIVRTDTMTAIDDDAFSMNVIWDQMAARGGLFGARYSGQWCDVGQPSSIKVAEAMLDV